MTKYTGDSGLFVFTLIIPEGQLSSKNVRGQILRQLQIYGRKVQLDFEKTVATWNDPADFGKPIVRYAGGNPRVSIVTQSDKWRWLNYGTSVRWAGMHRDFRPKTKVGSFQSGSGQGPSEPVWRGYGSSRARPGIEARDWTGLARKKYRAEMHKSLTAAIRKGLSASKGKP